MDIYCLIFPYQSVKQNSVCQVSNKCNFLKHIYSFIWFIVWNKCVKLAILIKKNIFCQGIQKKRADTVSGSNISQVLKVRIYPETQIQVLVICLECLTGMPFKAMKGGLNEHAMVKWGLRLREKWQLTQPLKRES